VTPETQIALLKKDVDDLKAWQATHQKKIDDLVSWQKFVLGGAATIGILFGIFAAQIKTFFGLAK